MPSREFGPKKLKTLRQSLLQENLSRTYINSTLSRIRRAFKWGVSEELLPVEVYQALSTVSGLRKGRSMARETLPVLPVPDEVVEATLPHLPQVVADMVKLERLSGMRPGEVCRLRPCDLDRSGEVWLYRPGEHKTEHHQRERVISLGPQAQQILWKYLARDPERHCFRPSDSEEKRRAQLTATRVTPLSCGNRVGTNSVAKPKRSAGEHYDSNSYRRAIHRACDKAFPHPELGQLKRRQLNESQVTELKKWQAAHRWSPNQLRHAAATEVRRKFGLEEAQIVLGHSRADITQVYAERDLSRGIEVAKKIG
jgi:integrase